MILQKRFVRVCGVAILTLLACSFPALSRSPDLIPTEEATAPSETIPASQEPAGQSTLPASRPEPGTFNTYYIRPDGGTAEQCNGLADAPYPGSGRGQPCAWDHPFRALPPGGQANLAGGDTLLVAPGSYKMGYGAPGTDGLEACNQENSWDCYMAPLPSGPDADHPTRLLGAGWDTGCANPPQLWGVERANMIVNLTGSSNVQLACLEISDHSGCVEDHTGGLVCNRDNPPFGEWAPTGIYAEDSASVHLADLNIHGLAARGIQAGRLQDWTVERVRIAANGSAGWDFDLSGDSTNSENKGTLAFRRLTVEWNGCGETYPEGNPSGCWGQSAGGYGDGFGMGGTSAGHWIIEDSAFLYNTSDGIDMLYTRLPGSMIEIRRVEARGNAGNQIKITGPAVIENSLVVSNCGFFAGKAFTFQVDDCRAAGDAILLALRPDDQVRITQATITGQGNCLISAVCALDQKCTGTEKVTIRNSIFVGQARFDSPADSTCFAWYNDESGDTLPHSPFDVDYSLFSGGYFGNVTADCQGAHNRCDLPAGLADPSLEAFDAHLMPGSPAIDTGLQEFAPPDDLEQRPRPSGSAPDMGVYETQQN
jgi:hypothetical protein